MKNMDRPPSAAMGNPTSTPASSSTTLTTAAKRESSHARSHSRTPAKRNADTQENEAPREKRRKNTGAAPTLTNSPTVGLANVSVVGLNYQKRSDKPADELTEEKEGQSDGRRHTRIPNLKAKPSSKGGKKSHKAIPVDRRIVNLEAIIRAEKEGRKVDVKLLEEQVKDLAAKAQRLTNDVTRLEKELQDTMKERDDAEGTNEYRMPIINGLKEELEQITQDREGEVTALQKQLEQVTAAKKAAEEERDRLQTEVKILKVTIEHNNVSFSQQREEWKHGKDLDAATIDSYAMEVRRLQPGELNQKVQLYEQQSKQFQAERDQLNVASQQLNALAANPMALHNEHQAAIEKLDYDYECNTAAKQEEVDKLTEELKLKEAQGTTKHWLYKISAMEAEHEETKGQLYEVNLELQELKRTSGVYYPRMPLPPFERPKPKTTPEKAVPPPLFAKPDVKEGESDSKKDQPSATSPAAQDESQNEPQDGTQNKPFEEQLQEDESDPRKNSLFFTKEEALERQLEKEEARTTALRLRCDALEQKVNALKLRAIPGDYHEDIHIPWNACANRIVSIGWVAGAGQKYANTREYSRQGVRWVATEYVPGRIMQLIQSIIAVVTSIPRKIQAILKGFGTFIILCLTLSFQYFRTKLWTNPSKAFAAATGTPEIASVGINCVFWAAILATIALIYNAASFLIARFVLPASKIVLSIDAAEAVSSSIDWLILRSGLLFESFGSFVSSFRLAVITDCTYFLGCILQQAGMCYAYILYKGMLLLKPDFRHGGVCTEYLVQQSTPLLHAVIQEGGAWSAYAMHLGTLVLKIFLQKGGFLLGYIFQLLINFGRRLVEYVKR